MKTILSTSLVVQEKVHTIFKLFIFIILHKHVKIKNLLRIMDGLNVNCITPF